MDLFLKYANLTLSAWRFTSCYIHVSSTLCAIVHELLFYLNVTVTYIRSLLSTIACSKMCNQCLILKHARICCVLFINKLI